MAEQGPVKLTLLYIIEFSEQLSEFSVTKREENKPFLVTRSVHGLVNCGGQPILAHCT